MSSIKLKVKRMPAISQVVVNPIINKEEMFYKKMNKETKRVKSLEESPFKNYGLTIFSEIKNQEKLLNSSSSGSVAVLNRVEEKVEIKDMLALYFEEKNSCSRYIDRKRENSA